MVPAVDVVKVSLRVLTETFTNVTPKPARKNTTAGTAAAV